MYCIITTCSVECYWHSSDETVHYKSDETMNFCGFRCATKSPITIFINVVFYIYQPLTAFAILLNEIMRFTNLLDVKLYCDREVTVSFRTG